MFMQNASAFRRAEKIGFSLNGLPAAPGLSRAGILAASLIETPQGWCRAGALMRGSLVQTWDGGLRPVAALERSYLVPETGDGLIHVPGGALDNCADLWLMPGQAVLIGSDVVREVLEAEGALVPARDLVGFRGIGVGRTEKMAEMVTLRFAEDEIAYVNSGALVHCAGLRGM